MIRLEEVVFRYILRKMSYIRMEKILFGGGFYQQKNVAHFENLAQSISKFSKLKLRLFSEPH